MKFSLIVATLGRTRELVKLFNSLTRQTCQDFEVIVVDQNEDGRLRPIIEEFSRNLEIIHLRSEPGLSRARNLGLEKAKGEIIAFPDDDCWYHDKKTLDKVNNFLNENSEYAGIAGITVDSLNKKTAAKFHDKDGKINIYNLWNRGNSATIFITKSAILDVEGFDIRLGVGAKTKWQSGEESDLLIRLLKEGYKVYYQPSLSIGHPNPIESYDVETQKRGYKYGLGLGKVLSKNNYPLWFVIYFWLRPIGGIILSITKFKIGKMRYHMSVLKGRILGWVG